MSRNLIVATSFRGRIGADPARIRPENTVGRASEAPPSLPVEQRESTAQNASAYTPGGITMNRPPKRPRQRRLQQPPRRPLQRPRRTTIEDVAEAAGVSVATVSRALRNLPNVATSTRQRVADIAQKLGYSADPAASRLAAGRTKTVTVVVPNLAGWYFSHIVDGVEAVCAEAGYDVLVVGVGSRNDLSRILAEVYHLERRTDGLVVIDVPVSAEQAASINDRGVALTTVGYETAGQSSLRIDNAQVGRIAADHLADLGHCRLGVIGGQKDDPLGFEVPTLRFEGFMDALERRNMRFDHGLIEGGNFGVDGGQEAMAALLDRAEPPTAVFALSDEMAFGALMELARRGLVAGRDVSLIGVDDHEFSRVVSLTTVRQPVSDHGAASARLLLDAIQSVVDHRPHHAVQLVAPVELVVRSTTGPLREGPLREGGQTD